MFQSTRTSVIQSGSARIVRSHPYGSTVAVVILVLGARLACLPFLPKPVPLIPDEQSNLLLAETLAAGRLTNPVHPMRRHFETLFVLQQPSYASVYPPAQGALLATGLLVANEPWTGVLAGIAAMCAAFVWMLRAYVTPPWALYGGFLTGAGFGLLNYWVNSYWGGACAAIGGALVFGAFPRVTAARQVRHAVLLGLGLLILANSRPFEGLLAALPVGVSLVWKFCQRPPDGASISNRQALALTSVLVAGAVLTGWYCWRVTGNPFRLPHAVYAAQYAATPAFVWQQSPRNAPEYADTFLRDAHLSFGIDYTEYATVDGAARKSFRKLARLATFYWGPLWILALLALPDFIGRREFRTVSLSLAFCVCGILQTVGFQVHYAAPCASIFVLILVHSLREARLQWKRLGTALAVIAPLVWIGSQALERGERQATNSLYSRPGTEARIAVNPGQHVVFVHYNRAQHPLGEEWVYNEPDVDRAKVIWARDLGTGRNAELADYYPDRTFWLVEPDNVPVRVTQCAPLCTATDGDRVR